MKEIITYEQICDLVRGDTVDRAHADECLLPTGDVVEMTVERFDFGIRAFGDNFNYIYCTHPKQYQLGGVHPKLCQHLDCRDCLINRQILEGVTD